jgi:hypothetical protein
MLVALTALCDLGTARRSNFWNRLMRRATGVAGVRHERFRNAAMPAEGAAGKIG